MGGEPARKEQVDVAVRSNIALFEQLKADKRRTMASLDEIDDKLREETEEEAMIHLEASKAKAKHDIRDLDMQILANQREYQLLAVRQELFSHMPKVDHRDESACTRIEAEIRSHLAATRLQADSIRIMFRELQGDI